MKTIFTPLAFVAAICLMMLVQGCDQGHDHASNAGSQSSADAHAALHVTKYNEVLVEFPGHKYSMEIIDEAETTGQVTAFITDAHFDPVAVDTREVRLNFIVNGKPKTFTLARIEQKTGEPVTFTLTNMELATLICEGWQGDATAMVEISGTPYNAKLQKLSEHEHDH